MEKSTHTKEYAALRAELCRAREKCGLSQRQLAARLKVPHSWVAKVESGDRRLDLVELCWFLLACGEEPLNTISRLLKKFPRTSFSRDGKGGRLE
jgi:transcriptional regulator with XRE-family HTH domain